jgi:prepilin-type processing-associated H-X9-DG protein
MDGMQDFRQRTQRTLSTRSAQERTAFTVLELLVTTTIIGVVAALLLPAVMSARESARRTMCTSHLREVGLAIQNHHVHHRRIPAAWVPTRDDSQFAYGWAAELLSEIEQPGLHCLLSPANRPPRLTSLAEAETYSLPLLLCPSDIADRSFVLEEEVHDEPIADSRTHEVRRREPSQALAYLPATNYVGVYGTVEADDFTEFDGRDGESFGDGSVIDQKRVNFADLQRGLSQTVLVGERKMATVPSTWLGIDLRGEDAPCRLTGSAITSPNCETCDECEFSSRHVGGSNFLWADGHVAMINDSIDTLVYRESARRLTLEEGW